MPRNHGVAGQPLATFLLRRRTVQRVALAGVGMAIAACVPASDPGALAPTLSIVAVRGGEVAVQNGIPVPTFSDRSRPRLDLNGRWRVERQRFDSNLSLTPRNASLDRIVALAAGREQPAFDDAAWETVEVPGSLNAPPDRTEIGGWYRRTFVLPGAWTGRTLTLKFGAANYLADVWLNGTWLGYHEGGTTPFAVDATAAARLGQENVLVVRVDNPPWGTRNDIVPWGLADWWNFGGITRPVWLEASDPVHVVRADVVPHLDGADISLVLRNAGSATVSAEATVEVFPATVGDANLLTDDPSALLAGGPPVVAETLRPERLVAADVVRVDASLLIPDARTWSPPSPSLYVLRVRLAVDGLVVDELHDTFGLRQVAVDPGGPRVTLNGQPAVLAGVALHDQHLEVGPDGQLIGGIPTRLQILDQLRRARSAGARLVRTGHAPANPALLDGADRLGLAIWEEIPLYHYTPQTFGIAMRRGIPQQMLRELALRDMNRPSVLFHGLANESTGEEARTRALAELHDVDRAIDGTRLTGQAAYGFAPSDPTSQPLDVAGYTFYYGVFYGADPAVDTANALEAAHRTYPDKPIMALEFGRWADGAGGLEAQVRIFEATSKELFARRATLEAGFVSAGVWWTLDDYATLRPNLDVERFGLFDLDGEARPVGERVGEVFGRLRLAAAEQRPVTLPGPRPGPVDPPRSGLVMVAYALYGLALAIGILGLALLAMLRSGGRGRRHGPISRRAPEGSP